LEEAGVAPEPPAACCPRHVATPPCGIVGCPKSCMVAQQLAFRCCTDHATWVFSRKPTWHREVPRRPRPIAWPAAKPLAGTAQTVDALSTLPGGVRRPHVSGVTPR